MNRLNKLNLFEGRIKNIL